MSPAKEQDAPVTPVRLRGHHFVCLQFFRGKGYSDEFVENLRTIVERAAENPALVVAGADDVCAACTGLARDGSCLNPQASDLQVNRNDRFAWRILRVAPGDLLSLAEARRRLTADSVSAGRWRADACFGCIWESECEDSWDDLLGEEQRSARAAGDTPEASD